MATNNKRLLAYPLIDEIGYRQNIDSKQLNEMLKSIEESILRSILRSTDLSVKVDSLKLGVAASYNSLYLHEKSFGAYPTDTNVAFANSFSKEITGGRQNQNAGITTLNWDTANKQSKIPMVDNILSPNITITVDGSPRVDTDDVYNVLDNDPKTFWVEETSTEEHIFNLSLPPSLNKRFNYLEIVPFPIFGINITKVRYKDTQSIWQVLYDSDQLSTTYKPYRFYNNSGPIVFHLSPKEYNNEIEITYKVRDSINAMGFSNIDVSLIDYHNQATTIMIPFENLPNVTSITPTSIDLDFYIDGSIKNNYADFFSKNGGGIFLSNNDVDPDIANIAPVQGLQTDIVFTSMDISNGLWLKIVMNEVNMTTPVIRGCKLAFQTS